MFDIAILNQKQLLTRTEAAFYIGISEPMLYDLMDRPGFPAVVRIGNGRGRLFIHREKLNQWLEDQAGA